VPDQVAITLPVEDGLAAADYVALAESPPAPPRSGSAAA
jgi:hypothetical protein